MSGLTGNNILAGSSGQGGYEIEQSLRFNDDDSAYLSRTPASAGNRKTWTWSGWFKRGNLNLVRRAIFGSIPTSGNTNSNTIQFGFLSDDKFQLGLQTAYVFNSNQVFRDVGAWYHIIVSVDTTQASANDRIKVYINSDQITSWSLNNISSLVPQNGDLGVNQTDIHEIGSFLSSNYFDGYMAEVNFIDGQALTPSDFGETDLLTNQWIPKKYVGTYGTNGFYLDFSDSASLGADSSGNGNNFTPTNLAATDQVLDSPTNNFATLNPLFRGDYYSHTFNEGNLRWHSTNNSGVNATFGMSSGKWYWEVYQEANNGNTTYFGVIDSEDTWSFAGDTWTIINSNLTSGGSTNTTIAKDNVTVQSGLDNIQIGDIVGIAYDADNLEITFYRNGSQIGVTQSVTDPPSGFYIPALANGNTLGVKTARINFGQDSSFAGIKTAQNNTDANGIGDFYYAPPSGGYLALCTSNLPDISIALPEEHFNTVLWSGDNSSSRAITTGIAPDFVWYKDRTGTEQQSLYDSIRGAQTRLTSNSTATETNRINGLQSFDSTGFTVGSDQECNLSGRNYVGWNWKAGGTASSNTDGTITSTVSANTTAGFSIVSYTGTGANATVGHGLSQRPDMFIVKNRSASARSWVIWAESFSGSQAIEFDTSGVVTSTTSWNSSLPTSTVINLGTRVGTNESGQTFIAYCFHSVEGYSKIGSYTGNGSSDGAFVYTGFRPAFVMFKQTNYAYDWSIIDNKINPYNVADTKLSPHNTNAELTNVANEIDFVSNGFKCRNGHVMLNGSYNYLYLAFAESPFKYSNAR